VSSGKGLADGFIYEDDIGVCGEILEAEVDRALL
jgi:hypothetical protein